MSALGQHLESIINNVQIQAIKKRNILNKCKLLNKSTSDYQSAPVGIGKKGSTVITCHIPLLMFLLYLRQAL